MQKVEVLIWGNSVMFLDVEFLYLPRYEHVTRAFVDLWSRGSSLGMQEARAIESLQGDIYLQIKVHAVSSTRLHLAQVDDPL